LSPLALEVYLYPPTSSPVFLSALTSLPQDEIAQLVGATCVFIIGLIIIVKVTQILMKLGVAIIILGVLAVLFHDKLPL